MRAVWAQKLSCNQCSLPHVCTYFPAACQLSVTWRYDGPYSSINPTFEKYFSNICSRVKCLSVLKIFGWLMSSQNCALFSHITQCSLFTQFNKFMNCYLHVFAYYLQFSFNLFQLFSPKWRLRTCVVCTYVCYECCCVEGWLPKVLKNTHVSFLLNTVIAVVSSWNGWMCLRV